MKEAFRNLSWFFKQKKKYYFFFSILLVILSVTQVIPAKLLGFVIDEIENGTITVLKIILTVTALLLLPLVHYLVNYIYHYNVNKLGLDLSFRLRENYLKHLFELDTASFIKYTKGDLIARATNDLQNLTILATSFLQTVVYNICVLIAAVSSMIIIDGRLTLASIIIMPFMIFYLNKKRMKKRRYYRIHREIYADMTEKVLESVEGVKAVRAYGLEEDDFLKTKEAIDNDINSWWKIIKFENIYGPMFELIYAVCYFIAISLGAYMVINSTISTGELLSFLIYVGMIYGPLIALSNILNSVNNIIISDERYYEIMSIAPEVNENSENVISFNVIEFKDVSFKFPFDNFEVIKNISFSIKLGETIGIVGPTGAGKSTLIRQLLREFNVTSGEILIDGINIKHYKIDDVRALVGYVPQDHVLFRRTVDENILIGNPYASPKQIETAMTIADFKKDLLELPFGSDTMVAELGGSLSGGQRQRLSIARALVKNPEILILDDSLSAVDALTERNIIKQLKNSRSDKTNIIVAHRFSAVMDADKIIVLQKGKITDVGTHRELLKHDNWYKMQYLKQIDGEIYEES
jgi:ATP-binding cassette subfamily B protein